MAEHVKSEGHRDSKHGQDAKHGQGQKASQQGALAREIAQSGAVESDDSRLIVRVNGVDLNGTKSVRRALTKIRGIGIRAAGNIAIAFNSYAGVAQGAKIGSLTEEQVKKLEEVIQKQTNFGVPSWALNRQKGFYSGENSHVVMAELDLSLRNDLQRMSETKSYKGLRHMWGQPVRGQKTKSTHRGKGPVVGVMKKDAKQQAAASKAPAAGSAKLAAAAGKPVAKK